MTRIIPTSGTLPHYTQVTQIDGIDLRFTLDWNARASRWFLSIFEADTEAPIRLGIPIVDGWPLNIRVRHDALRSRWLVAYDTGESGVDPGISDLGPEGRTQLFAAPRDPGIPSLPPVFVGS